MPSERMQRRIDALLDEADEAITAERWSSVASKARAVLAIDADNEDAAGFLAMAVANGVPEKAHAVESGRVASEVHLPTSYVPPERPARSVIAAPAIVEATESADTSPSAAIPDSFAGGRYKVLRFLGEGGKKRVFLAHDALLDRDVAFSLIKTEGLDEAGRERIEREARAMGRLSHQNIVSIYDIGEHTAEDGSRTPYLVQELMGGGDVEALLEGTEGAVDLPRVLEIATATARGLEYAHAHGVVHRDLKPGNVWLTSDGVAKIGDLGLAVTEGQTRLTSHGMMVGTYGYMPPEQALGQDVTPQADLYSLGAMLYELVTGRPPFQGDTPTAVISQHLNTQPVAPSWYGDHCPPNLEALILDLLAKVPADRPASASEVLTVLEAVDPAGRSASHSDTGANPLDRLARGVFVGRQHELERLRSAFDDAYAGRGSVVMVVGEPGIGKTRTTQELATYVRMRSGMVLWGGAQESSGAPPYWPWVLAARSYRDQTPEEERRRQYQPYAADLQRVFAGLRELFPGLPEPPPLDSEEGQFRLFDAFSSFLRAVALDQPLLVVLDDLHWTDRATLQMLTHVARELSHARVLVVGTYRDTDLDRQHPLSSALGELNREELFTRLNLRGLTRDEVGEYIRATTQVDPAPPLVDRVYEETEGNAFFLAEVVNLMAQEGAFDQSSVSDVSIPEGVKEALGRRLDRLSEEANELLSVAAVLGREFRHEELVTVSGTSDDDVLRLIEEALAARVAEETEATGGYRFTHALMQETLLGELSAARRVRTHGQIAEALEALYGGNTEANAPALARHYVESAAINRAHAVAAARYSRVAAERAVSAFAWDEASRHFETCLSLIESEQLAEPEQGRLLIAAAKALRLAGNEDAAWRMQTDALEFHRSRGEWNGFAEAAVESERFLDRPRRTSMAITREALLHDDVSPRPRARLLSTLARLTRAYPFLAEHEDESEQARREAGAIAARAGLKDVEARLQLDDAIDSSLDSTSMRARAERAHSLAVEASELTVAAESLSWIAMLLAWVGGLDDATEIGQRAADYARSTHARQLEADAYAALSSVCTLRADYEEARRLTAQARALSGVVNQYPWWAAIQGDLEALQHEELDDLVAGPLNEALLISGLVLAGKRDEALERFEPWRAQIEETWLAPRNAIGQQPFGLGAVAIAELGDDEMIAAAYEAALSSPYRAFHSVSADYCRGLFAVELDLIDEAEQHFRAGLEWCERERCPVEAGRCHQGLAEVAQRRGNADVAREHLDAAGTLFSKHEAKLYLDQVIAKKEILKA